MKKATIISTETIVLKSTKKKAFKKIESLASVGNSRVFVSKRSDSLSEYRKKREAFYGIGFKSEASCAVAFA